jgi:hypothetical protein
MGQAARLTSCRLQERLRQRHQVLHLVRRVRPCHRQGQQQRRPLQRLRRLQRLLPL